MPSANRRLDFLSMQERNGTRRLDALAVKGKHEAVTVFEVLWQTGSDHTQMPGRLDTVLHQAGVARLRLAHGGSAISFGHSPRDRNAEIVAFWCESSGDGKE